MPGAETIPEAGLSARPRPRWLRCWGSLTLAVATTGALLVGAVPAGASPATATTAAAQAPATVASINDLARTPYQGWNTYYGLGSTFTEQTIKDEADALVSRGLKAAGYNYVWIDGGWWSGTRDGGGNITVDPTQWPDGMKAVADYVHAKGLKVGIYTDAGTDGCGGTSQGSYGRYQQDVNQFAAWGYDAVKVDFCGGEKLGLNPAVAYGQFRDALLKNSSERPMLFNICNPFVPETGAAPGRSAYDSYSFGPTTGNSWRTDTDVGFVNNVQFADVLRNLDDDAKHPEAAGPGHWNDPDYLAPQLGMTSAEYHAQFSMWSMVAAPLIIGSDVRSLSADTVGMLTNPEVLAIDQDKLGVQGTAIATVGDTQVWSKPLANGDRAVALFNRGTTPAVISTSAAQLGLRAALGYQLRDVWAHTSTETASKVSAAVPAHSVVLLRISTTRDLLGTPPSVTLSPVLIPPTYPGAPVDLAVPGQPLSASATFTNNARTPVADASLTLVVPAGWTLTPSGVSKAGLLATGQTITENWLVTPAPGTLPGSQDLSALASYRWYGLNTTTGPGLISHQVTTRSSTTVQVPSAPPSGNAVLSDQAWLRGTSGYLVPRLDQEVAGGGLVMLGKSYAKGIGTASPSTIDYYLGGNCTNLSATVGIDDSADFDPTGGTAVFQVYGDGVKLYDSGLVTRTATRAVSVALGQAKVLSLVVGNGGDGGYNDRADWAGLQLSCGAPVTTVPAGPWPMFVNPAAQTATTSSSQVGYPASNAVDGQLSTLWHSQFSPVHDPLPISLTVDLESAQTITGLTYQPRLDGTTTGIITGYTIATSQDGVSFTQAAPDGTWGQDSSLKSVALKAVTARYVRLTATSAVNGYASAAEIAVAVQPAQ